MDNLAYTYGTHSNKLVNVHDHQTTNTYQSKDFKNLWTQNYTYDSIGNQTSNSDKDIASIEYNHLNLPKRITFTDNTGKIEYDYDANGNKLTQRVYQGSTLSSTTDYVGEFVFENNGLSYIVHEEGRVVYENGSPVYEYFIKDHLGNVRQVLREGGTESLMATMETENSETEGQHFRQLDESRQSGVEHNVTAGGDKVAWLNAGRGRVFGPNASREVRHGETINLSVHGKYENPRKKRRANKASFLTAGARQRILTDIVELSRSGSGNPIAVLQLVDLIAQDLQTKKSPEAYLYYALYDGDSNLYETGKKVLTKKAENRHEELTESLYISKSGYMETFVANETGEDVWFDNFRIQVEPPLVVQETHYDPWGLELTGLGYQYGGIKINRYLYQGKEFLDDLSLNIYDFHARGYDPVIGRTWQLDPHAENYFSLSPYSWVANNPLRFIDPDGKDIIGTDGKKVTYQMVNGNAVWSKNASPDVQRVGNALLRTESGTGQLNKAMNSSVKISIYVSDQTVKTERGFLGGTTKYGEVTKSRLTGEYKAGAAEISIFEGSIDKLLSGESGKNELSEAGIGKEAAIGVIAGHEIEHATNAENTDQVYKNRLEGKNFDVEAVPNRLHRNILKEEKEKLKNGN